MKIAILFAAMTLPALLRAEVPCQEEAPCVDTPYGAPAYLSTATATTPVFRSTTSYPPEYKPSPAQSTSSFPTSTLIPSTAAAYVSPELTPSRLQKAVERYPTGELLSEKPLFDGKPDGLAKEFYKNGQVMGEWNYRLGKLHGESRAYYRSGDLKTTWEYKDGVLDGETRHYHPRKILKSVEVYKDGALVRRRTFDETGLPIDQAR